jgi:hypothetical protein
LAGWGATGVSPTLRAQASRTSAARRRIAPSMGRAGGSCRFGGSVAIGWAAAGAIGDMVAPLVV